MWFSSNVVFLWLKNAHVATSYRNNCWICFCYRLWLDLSTTRMTRMRTMMKAKRPAPQKERAWTLPSICLGAASARGADSCEANHPGQNFHSCIRNILSQQMVATCREHESRSREIQSQETIWHEQVDPPIFAAKFESTREFKKWFSGFFFVNSPVTYTMLLHIGSWRAVLLSFPFLSFFRKLVRFESL